MNNADENYRQLKLAFWPIEMCALYVYFSKVVCAQVDSCQMNSPVQINQTFGPSDYWALGLSGPRTIGPSDYRTPDYRTLGLMGPRTIGPSNYRFSHPLTQLPLFIELFCETYNRDSPGKLFLSPFFKQRTSKYRAQGISDLHKHRHIRVPIYTPG